MKRHTLLITLSLLAYTPLLAQSIDYRSYIERVLKENPSHQVAQLELEAARHTLKAAHAISNPTLSAEYGNNSDWDIAMGQSLSVELSKTFTLGKRAANIHVAEENYKTSEAALADATNTLRAEATSAYIDALLAKEITKISKECAENMARLYRSDSLRAARGDLSELDALQSKLEANMAMQDYRTAMSDYRNALTTLTLLMGDARMALNDVEGTLFKPNKSHDLDVLIQEALMQRPDLMAAHYMANAAQSELVALRRERTPDIDLSIGANYNTQVLNEEAPAPKFMGYTAGISLPLPIGNLNRGEILSGQIRVRQAQLQAEVVENQIQAEILQAYNNYLSAINRVEDFDTFLLENAKLVLEGRIYAYSRGETSLLEVINAQHTYNETLTANANALHDSMQAWVELNHAAALWEIEL